MYNYFVFFVFGKLWIYIPNLVKNQVDFWSQSVKSEGFFFVGFFWQCQQCVITTTASQLELIND